MERAIEIEIERQIEVLEGGGTVAQETRLYDEVRDETRSMRSKEEAEDYRYFPDPDLLPVVIGTETIAAIRAALPELPDARRHRFVDQYGLAPDLADQLTASRAVADYFEAVQASAGGDARISANWITGELTAHLNRDQVEIDASPVTPGMLAGLLARIDDETVSGTGAKEVLAAMWDGEGDADGIIASRGLRQMSDSGALEEAVDKVLAENPDQVEQYRAGKTKVMGFLVGQVMKASGGKANPKRVSELMKRRLG